MKKGKLSKNWGHGLWKWQA